MLSLEELILTKNFDLDTITELTHYYAVILK